MTEKPKPSYSDRTFGKLETPEKPAPHVRKEEAKASPKLETPEDPAPAPEEKSETSPPESFHQGGLSKMPVDAHAPVHQGPALP